jgi:ribose 5-phosphate isomerase B
MKIAIASDHRGYKLKEYIKKNLKGIEIIDLGTASEKKVDYPDYAFKLGEYVINNKCFGVAICGSGIGISIACNKVKGIRCAKVNSIKDAIITRKDNDSNVVAFSSSTNEERALKIVKAFIYQEFTNEERHIRRISKISEYEKSN